MTAVRVIFIKLPTAVEIAVSGRSSGRNDLALRILAAMAILGRVRLRCSLTLTLPCRVDPDHEHTIAPVLDEMLKLKGQSDITKGDGLQKRGCASERERSAFCGVTRADIFLILVVREPNVRFEEAIRLAGCARV
ncbi:hypothetical protein [Bradyrhizobium sp. AUGA SZCCT0283]|uniref:hypothetical protein n=1 Tax=Bradyrhizobium sp. AUGA SZCCT0283 TaxID=2807671 RepID=UPI001BAA87BE|nr:hypothetical protein [Bradyrhizobium sp. AUGA SZCCT0283]MBR1279465.1 hypothetical protein [Bradyrhizobium sp. AUGA SZCCT0283]